MLIRSPKELAMLATAQRKQLGLTQTEVGDRVGLMQKTISAFENSPEHVMLSTAFLILSTLHLDVRVESKDKASDEKNKWTQEW